MRPQSVSSNDGAGRARRRSRPAAPAARRRRPASRRMSRPSSISSAIPPAAVGVGEQHLSAGGVEARAGPGLGQQDQGQQAGGLGVVGPERRAAPGPGAWRGRRARRRAARRPNPRCGPSCRRGGRAPHRRHALLDGDVVGKVDAGARPGDALLGPRQAGRHRRRRDEEGGGDRRRRHAAAEAHRERDLRRRGHRRMAAQHDQPQLVVADRRRSTASSAATAAPPRSAPSSPQPAAQVGRGRRTRSMARRRARGQQPRLDRVGDAALGPRLQREQEGVGRRLLGDVDVARHPQRGREHAAPVRAVGRRRGFRRLGHASGARREVPDRPHLDVAVWRRAALGERRAWASSAASMR